MKKMTAQFKSADIIVMAFPMHNFSLPGIVKKTYFDSILLKGETWDIGPNGYVGLMKGKKMIIISASGGDYQGKMSSWDHSMTLAEQLGNFMGFSEIVKIPIGGMNIPNTNIDNKILEGKEKIKSVLSDWNLFVRP